MDLKIDLKLLIFLILGFILATVIGTVSHEYGHYLPAEAYGLEAKVHYGYTTWSKPSDNFLLKNSAYFWITLVGPLQTMLVGIIGMILICKNRISFRNVALLSVKQWIIIFATLFLLRFSFNFLSSIPSWIVRGKLIGRSDEIKIARYLEWPTWSVSLFFASIGFIILVWIVFYVVPIKQRFTFILAGLIGGISGFVLWLDLFGKIIMP